MRKATWLACALAFLASCASPVPPSFRVFAPVDLSQPPSVFVSASHLREPIERSLGRAGLPVARTAREASLVLIATVGNVRSSTEDCGPVRNVKYELRQFGIPLATGRARARRQLRDERARPDEPEARRRGAQAAVHDFAAGRVARACAGRRSRGAQLLSSSGITCFPISSIECITCSCVML